MAAFATSTDLAVRLGVDLTADEKVRADALLGLASDLIRKAARQEIDLKTSTVTFAGNVGRVLLPERPVGEVTSVMVDDDFAEFTIEGDYLVGPFFGGRISVTYVHGFSPIPDAIKAVCLEVVTRVWVNPGNAAQEAYGSERVSHGATTGLVLTDDERRAVRDVVRRGSQMVDIR